jgi:myosin heavy subunit
MRKEKKAFYAEVSEGDFAERIRKINEEKGFKFKKEVIDFILELGVNAYENEDNEIKYFEVITDETQTLDEYYEELNEDKILEMSEEEKVKLEKELDEAIKNVDKTLNCKKEVVSKAKSNIQSLLEQMDDEEIILEEEKVSKERIKEIKDAANKIKDYKEQELIFKDEGNREEEWAKQEKELEKAHEMQERMYKLAKKYEDEIKRNNKKKNYKEANYKTLLKYVNNLKELQMENGDRICNICKYHEEGFDCICKKGLSLHDIGCEDMTNNVQGICEAWRE